MGKYDQLRGKLEAQPASLRAFSLSFQQIEDVLGKPLPPSARAHRPWWSNSRHVQAKAWQAAGWEVDSVDLAAEWVRFTRMSGTTTDAVREPVEPIYPFNKPGDPIVLHRGDIEVAADPS